jgi:phosphoglycolate phosphatase
MEVTTTIDAVLFDLDGTLVDTAPCIAAALNQALAANGFGSIAPVEVTAMIGGGVPMLIERALTKLGKTPGPQIIADMLVHYRAVYLTQPGPTPALFPAVERALLELHEMDLKLGVVTNTFDRFLRTLLHRTGLARLFDITVSADTVPERKPHPAPLLYACDALSVAPANALFVGDSRNDAEAAQAAHMRMVCMTYGYNEGRPVAALPCDAFLGNMGELPKLLAAWQRSDSTGRQRAASD